ncbi:hypothetical protein AX17_002247 [Amanita inopinata Kibby_2008]|nr:hypothetical protein AX17_002247 [Amanita inopinata Kibby_2008]
MTFGERVSPVAAIQAILHDYPFSASILRELLQNSDDAGAKEQVFVLDKRRHSKSTASLGPALLAYNDATFHEADWEAIQSIHQSSKRADTSKIGKYGVGFRACYHITDEPQILSGPYFATLSPLDPSRSKKYDYEEFNKTEYVQCFRFLPAFSEGTSFPGTAIRLPLRTSPSELSRLIVRTEELHQMFTEYIAEELNLSLLFLDRLRSIKVWEIDDTGKTSLAHWTKSEKQSLAQAKDVSFITYNSVLSDNGGNDHTWRIVQSQMSKDETVSRLKQLVKGDLVLDILEKHKLRADIRIAYPIAPPKVHTTSGRLFTFLPLPSRTSFPAHIHALFALTSSRQSLRNSKETGVVQGADDDVLIKWNHLLFDEYIPQTWSYLLRGLIEDDVREGIFRAWPSYCPPVSSGDGLYWQNVLSKTLNIALESGLAIWPKISKTGTGNGEYVELKSSLVAAQDEVHVDILSSLAELGLTLVQLPQTHINLLHSSVTKLTPKTAHIRLKDKVASFENISPSQRSTVCRYLLSDNDLCNVFGLPLFPLLNGSFVSLDDRQKTLHRNTALKSDEIKIFQASTSEAIPLSLMDSKIADLLLKEGPTKANIDLLTPSMVLSLLAAERKPRTDGQLIDFWLWLDDWHLGRDLIHLLKVNTKLCLIPTTRGPEPVPSLVFAADQSAGNKELFERLGLLFASSRLPTSVVRLLKKHGILKDADNLDDFIAAINPNITWPVTERDAQSIFRHLAARHRSGKILLTDQLVKLRQLPIYPVLVPLTEVGLSQSSNSSVKWRNIQGLGIVKGISPMKLIPSMKGVHFLDKSSFDDATCSLLKALKIQVLEEKDIITFALDCFSSLPKSLQAAFVSYIKDNAYRLPTSSKEALRKNKFLRTTGGVLQSPSSIIDPSSSIAKLYTGSCNHERLARNDDRFDEQILSNLRALQLIEKTLTANIVQERISYISSNHTSPTARDIALSLLSLMNDTSFMCTGIHVNQKMKWLPTAKGLVSSSECVESGRRDTDLFDEVLTTLDSSIRITASFKALLDWDEPLELDVIKKQLTHVLEGSRSESSHRKIRAIIGELGQRNLSDGNIKSLQGIVAQRPWVPTASAELAPHSRAVFVSVPDRSGFYEIGFPSYENQICRFLERMGCQKKPTAGAIIDELKSLQNRTQDYLLTIEQAVQLLKLLPESITDEEYGQILVPTEAGTLVPLKNGVYYYGGDLSGANRDEASIAHHLIDEEMADRLRIDRLGIDLKDDCIDLGEKPITTIRNTLRQYNPRQFFTEFIANASDAKAQQFSILIDEHKGPTAKLFSKGMKAFQGASLVIYNDGVFTAKDFKGIRETGIGGKRGKRGTIGHFGLGALSMFHFTELAMIVSGDSVLFLNPSKQNLSYRDRNAFLLPLAKVKSLYPDHLEPLDGLFGFDMSSQESYNGTIFRLPLRNDSHISRDPVSKTPWETKEVQDMLLEQFDALAYKSLLFTAVTRIEISTRRDSEQADILCSIQKTCRPDVDSNLSADVFKSEIVTFKATRGASGDLPRWLVVTKELDMPGEHEKQLADKYDMHHLLPVRIAAALDVTDLTKVEHNLFCSLPLPITTSLPVHISAPLILEQERRNIRIDGDGVAPESKYNRWLLSSPVPQLYLYLLERLLLANGGKNVSSLPGVGRKTDVDDNIPTRILLDAFWAPEMLGRSDRKLFVSQYESGFYLKPSDAVVFFQRRCLKVVSKIISISKPPNVSQLPDRLVDYARKAGLRNLDAMFFKSLLLDAAVASELTKEEIPSAINYLRDEKVSLDGLKLLPLEDESRAVITTASPSSKVYYVLDSQKQVVPFNPNRLVHRDFDTHELLGQGYNISRFTDDGIVELAEDRFPTTSVFAGDRRYQHWVSTFWNAGLHITPNKISHLPLVPILASQRFMSINEVKKPSTIVASKDSIYSLTDRSDLDILQSLGMTVVVKDDMPKALVDALPKEKPTVYFGFLSYIQPQLGEILKKIQGLRSEAREQLVQWIHSKLTYTPTEHMDVVFKLPIWRVEKRGESGNQLHALDEVTILPPQIPADVLRPFTDHLVINYEEKMHWIKKSACSPKRVTELVQISPNTVLRTPAQRSTYKELLGRLVNFGKINGFTPLVPNERHVLTPVDQLYERDQLFRAAFNSQPQRLISEECQELVPMLEKYGLNLKRQLDLSMFIVCAKAFHGDTRRVGRRNRSLILYTAFNELSLSYWSDKGLCAQLDGLKFIPRSDIRRPGYHDIDIGPYTIQEDILSPNQIVLPEYEAICWSQRGKTDPPPNSTLCGTYTDLGKPTARDVVEHLKVLAEIGREHGRNEGLLSDLKATYKWLNERADEVGYLILQEDTEPVFLNVSDPGRDEWVWHSATELVIDLHDTSKWRDVQGFLKNYMDLLTAASIRKVHKAKTDHVVEAESTRAWRECYNDMRLRGCLVDVAFCSTQDNEYEVPPAHRSFLCVNSAHFRTSFTGGFMESLKSAEAKGSLGDPIDVDAPSRCLKEVLDWIYVGELPKSFTKLSARNKEEKTIKINLALDMLHLAHYWELKTLHAQLQVFIINADDELIDPDFVKDIKEHAEVALATELLEACKKYEKDNWDLM